MRILFITPSFPSRLARIRSYHLIKYLSRYHEIYLLSLHKKGDFLRPEEIDPYCKAVHVVAESPFKSIFNALLALPTSSPLEVGYCRSKNLKKEVKRLVGRYKIDLLYVKRLRTVQFVEDIKEPPALVDTTDAMSMHYERSLKTEGFLKKPLFFEEYLKYKWYEKKMLNKFLNWIVCSEKDKDYLLRTHQNKKTKIYVIENGVDTEYYYPREILPERNSILFSGIMYRYINSSAAHFLYREILPYIRKAIPEIKLTIAGPNPPSAVRRLQRDPAVKIKGFAEDIREEILKNEVVVCPLLAGSGTRNKILQAWAMGRPIVSTSLGAEGLYYEHGKDILIGDNPKEFASHVLNVLKNENLRNDLVQEGFQKIQKYYDMNIVVKKLERLFDEII